MAAVGTLALGLTVGFAWAQHEPAEQRAEEATPETSAGEGGMELWAWLNFALLAAGLVWIFRKNAVPYFASRALSIRKGMIEAEDARAEAERRMADVEARLARLQTDVQTLKDEAMQEAKSEQGRARQETEAALAKIRLHGEQDIQAAGKAARLELKRYSAELALGMAEQKIRARMDPATQNGLFRGFLQELDRGSRPLNN